jgi:integrase
MGNVFMKAYTKPVPPAAEVVLRDGRRLARWRDTRGKVRTAPLTTGQDGSDRIALESRVFYARYRDGNGVVVEAPTGCRDEAAARSVLADLERRAERVRAGLLTPAEDRIAGHLRTPLGDHVRAYLDSLRAAEVVPLHLHNTGRYLARLADACGFARLADLSREALEGWLAREAGAGRSARSRNTHRAAAVAFAGWCVTTGRLASNPFAGVPRANEKADPRRKRRAMTEDELLRLLDVARRRPLDEALTVRRGKRKGERYSNVRPEVRARLEALGQERALVYKTLVLTGLRKNELATLTVAQLRLDGPVPHAELDAADEKNREGGGVVVRPDLAEDLRRWLEDKFARLQAEARRAGAPIPARLPGTLRVFNVPDGLVRIFDRDLRAAGIPKRDERGRTLDVHALRTTFGTLLGKGGAPVRAAQEAMRHSDPKLTATVYTDPKLLDVLGALEVLPTLPLSGGDRDQERAAATGTEGPLGSRLAPPLARTECKPTQSGSTAGKVGPIRPAGVVSEGDDVTGDRDNRKGPLTVAVSGPAEYARQDLNLQPLAPEASVRCGFPLFFRGLRFHVFPGGV